MLEIKEKILRDLEKLKHKEGFLKAGLPKFPWLFGRDALISAWQLLDKMPSLARATLKILSKHQGKKIDKEKEEEPGKILHETDLRSKMHPKGYFPFPYYGSVDSTCLFLILFSFYFKRTKDIGFLDQHWENILSALNWIIEYGDQDQDYFLEYQRKNPKGLFHQGWKDSFKNHLKIEPPVAMVEVQGYQYLALLETSLFCQRKKNFSLAQKLKERAKSLKKEFNQKFWMEDKKYFALALDGKKEQRKAITSNPGHLLFTRIIEKNKIELVVRRLFQKDLWTPFGIRTHSSLEPDFDPKSYHLGSVWPHDNWIIAQGLKKLGYLKEYQKIKKAILKAFEKLGFIPEFYGVIDGKITLETKTPPCHLQAWSSGALFNFVFE